MATHSSTLAWKIPWMQEPQETQVRSLGEEDPLEKGMTTHSIQYSCLENSMERGVWQATVHGVTKSQTCPV